jgi:hypothetical protein
MILRSGANVDPAEIPRRRLVPRQGSVSRHSARACSSLISHQARAFWRGCRSGHDSPHAAMTVGRPRHGPVDGTDQSEPA